MGDTTALAAWHEERGARWREGRELAVATYGRPSRESEAIDRGAALVDRTFNDRIELTGADRHRFLNGFVTCDVKNLTPGENGVGFFTNSQGRILADVRILAFDDRLWLEVPADQGPDLVAHLKRFVIADRVEIRRLEDRSVLALVGPEAEELTGRLVDVGPSLAPGVRQGGFGSHDLVVDAGPWWGVAAVSLWIPSSSAVDLADGLEAGGAIPTGLDAFEARRVEQGFPRWGRDYDQAHFPQETGLEKETVSYTKGCYLGQEVVARIHYRGGVQRGLVGLVLDDCLPEGLSLLFEDREVGTLGSVVHSPKWGWIALAVLHRRASEPGTEITAKGHGTARVTSLPFS